MKSFLLLAVALLAPASAALAQATRTPNQVLDLGPWNLTLPVDANGGTTGRAATVHSPLRSGYSSAWFYTTPAPADSSVRFWCPSNGATTSPGVGSDHPRTELHEDYVWPMNLGGSLTATMQVLQYPPLTRDIVIGQIHGGGTTYGSVPFVLLHIMGGSVTVSIKTGTASSAPYLHGNLISNVALGAKISYGIVTDGRNITITASAPGALGSGRYVVPVPTPWLTIPVHFSAGDYVQDISANPTDGGLVAFYRLRISHGPTATAAGAAASAFTISPTLATDFITATGPAGATLALADALGRVLVRHTLGAAPLSVPVQALPPGVYFATLATGSGRQLRRFVKQ